MSAVRCFGELLVDRFPGRWVVGGAPFNVAYGLASQGTPVDLISAVGSDPLGSELLQIVGDAGIHTGSIGVVSAPTGTVEIELDSVGQASYSIAAPAAWDMIQVEALTSNAGEAESSGPPWIYYGTLALRAEVSRDSWRALLRNRDRETSLFCDLNLRATGPDESVVLEAVQPA